MRRWLIAVVMLSCLGEAAQAQHAPEAAGPQISGISANSPVLERVLREWPAGRIANAKHPGEWAYEQGVLLDGVTAMWHVTGDGRLFTYLKDAVDGSVDKTGTIHMAEGAPFPKAAHSLDNIEMGRSVLEVYRVLQQERYYKAAKFLDDQLAQQPKNASGGYWHKQIYPHQMWLDGAYMAGPFRAIYARTFAQPAELKGAVDQLLLMGDRMRDPKTGLLRHGWDESKQMGWADKQTGLSPEAWARAMGWYSMALVDVLEQMPEGDPQRPQVEALTQRTLEAVIRYQDKASGLWWQVMDKGGRKGNYLETSASCMFVYAIAKAVRMGALPLSAESHAERGWAAIQKTFVRPDGTLTGTVKVAGLGGKPYRSGTYDYYVGEPVGDNDAKGVGAYLLAESEMLQHQHAGELFAKARGKKVLVDAWFNSQRRRTAAGNEELFHYKWDDEANSGYSVLGRMFAQYGMKLGMLDHAPKASDLRDVSIYVIVSPDNLKLNPKAHFMDPASAGVIEAWVKAGGVLVLMENDDQRADQVHLDLLTDRFGIHYNPALKNEELNGSYANTIVPIPAGTGGIFDQPFKALMKEVCTMTVSAPAKTILTGKGTDAEGDPIMAVAPIGRGVVYANVDPWVYNEYTDGRKSPMDEQNFAAGEELVRWLVRQTTANSSTK